MNFDNAMRQTSGFQRISAQLWTHGHKDMLHAMSLKITVLASDPKLKRSWDPYRSTICTRVSGGHRCLSRFSGWQEWSFSSAPCVGWLWWPLAMKCCGQCHLGSFQSHPWEIWELWGLVLSGFRAAVDSDGSTCGRLLGAGHSEGATAFVASSTASAGSELFGKL